MPEGVGLEYINDRVVADPTVLAEIWNEAMDELGFTEIIEEEWV